jgi:hypothetical protein
LLGRAPQVENLYLANGSSGHGVMHSPAIGQLLAEIMLDGAAHTLDTHTQTITFRRRRTKPHTEASMNTLSSRRRVLGRAWNHLSTCPSDALL